MATASLLPCCPPLLTTPFLLQVCVRVKAAPKAQMEAVLRKELGRIVLPAVFQLPLSSSMRARGIVVEKCKVETQYAGVGALCNDLFSCPLPLPAHSGSGKPSYAIGCGS